MPYIKQSRTEKVTHDVIVGATCCECNAELQPVMELEGVWTACHPVGSLDLSIGGGYGQFYDGLSIHAILCKSCAEKFVATFPNLGKAIEEAEEKW